MTAIKLLEENIEVPLHNLRLGSGMTPKAQETKEKNRSSGLHLIKTFCAPKKTIKKVKS